MSEKDELLEALGPEPWSLQKIALAFAKVSGNQEAVFEREQDYKGPTRPSVPDAAKVREIELPSYEECEANPNKSPNANDTELHSMS